MLLSLIEGGPLSDSSYRFNFQLMIQPRSSQDVYLQFSNSVAPLIECCLPPQWHHAKKPLLKRQFLQKNLRNLRSLPPALATGTGVSASQVLADSQRRRGGERHGPEQRGLRRARPAAPGDGGGKIIGFSGAVWRRVRVRWVNTI